MDLHVYGSTAQSFIAPWLMTIKDGHVVGSLVTSARVLMTLCRLKLTQSAIILLGISLSGSVATWAIAQETTSASAVARSVVYACPMHPDVRAETHEGHAALAATSAPLDLIEYGLDFRTTPAVAKPGEEIALRFRILHPKTGEQIKEFKVIHDMPFHLFIVSCDLEYYNHIHPNQQTDGSFTNNVTLPKPGPYEMFSDFVPVGGPPQVIRRSLNVASTHGHEHNSLKAPLLLDEFLIKSVDGIRFELSLQPSQPVAGQPTLLNYVLVNAETGLPVKDLQPYLGAWGHTVTLGEHASNFLHSHATRLLPAGVDRTQLIGGPRISFKTVFARPGPHRIWSEFQRKGKVITVSFTVNVSRLDRLAKWDGSTWSPLVASPSNGLDGVVRAIATKGNDVYLGGDFTTVDGIRTNRVVRWDGRRWLDLDSGVNGSVWAIAVNGDDVYVAGDFTMAGGKSANGIAKWDGRDWSALGSGVSGRKDSFGSPSVYALVVRGSEVYVGGQFATAGGVPANGIARWNGHSWSALDEGVHTGMYDGVVRALAVSGNDIYAGGQFISAGNVSAYNIARWNGQRWSALGSGIRGNLEQVLTLGVSGTDVLVGGIFTLAGGVNASNIAAWNGRQWSALAVKPFDGVQKIAVAGSDVYVGGSLFTLPSGAVTRGIVKWDGRHWSALGNGVGSYMYTGPIRAIAASQSHTYIGGDSFTMSPSPTE
jgi:hypothetical protein